VQKTLTAYLILPLFVLTAAGCASYDRMPAPTYLPDEGRYIQSSEEPALKVGIKPLDDEASQVDFFGQRLDKKLLPILIIIDNRSKRGYELSAQDIELMGADGKSWTLVPFDELYKEYFKKSVWSRGVGGFFAGAAIAAGTFLILAPAIIVMPVMCALNTKDVNQTIQSDLRRVSASHQFVADPGASSQAVAFFKYNKKSPLKGATLKLQNIHSLNSKDMPANFTFQLT
jgi:hypothetical protein